MAKERILYLDVSKFFAIQLVCIGHAYYMTIGIESNVRNVIYLFHMPLFMIISGYFSVHTYQKRMMPFLFRKSKQLLLPFLSYYVILFTYHTLEEGWNMPLVLDMSISLLWFLKTLFICYITVYFFKKTPFFPDWLCVILSCMFFITIPYGDTMAVSFMLPMFWVGYYWQKYYQWYLEHQKIITVASLIVFVTLAYFYVSGRLEQPAFTWASMLSEPLSFVSRILTGVSGSFLCIGAIYLVCNKDLVHQRIISVLGEVGQFTLGIFVVQFIVIEQIGKMFFSIHNISTHMTPWFDYVLTPIMGCMALLICYVLVRLLCKVKIINLLFFGNQYL